MNTVNTAMMNIIQPIENYRRYYVYVPLAKSESVMLICTLLDIGKQIREYGHDDNDKKR